MLARGTSGSIMCVGARKSPPSAPTVSMRVRTSRRTSSGEPNGKVDCVPIVPQRHEPLAEAPPQRDRVHALRLHGVEDVDADLDQVLDDGRDVAVAVEEDQDVAAGPLARPR